MTTIIQRLSISNRIVVLAMDKIELVLFMSVIICRQFFGIPKTPKKMSLYCPQLNPIQQNTLQKLSKIF